MVSNRVAAPQDRATRAGGLAVALSAALRERGGLWFGWSGKVVPTDEIEMSLEKDRNVTFATVDLDPERHHSFYVQYSNGTLWPLCHLRPGLVEFRRGALEGYLAANEDFAARLAPMLEPEDQIWVHDYHFLTFAAELRRLGVMQRIGFFLHIPFPVPELLATLPNHRRLIRDLCAYDLIGFQTETDVAAFRRYLRDECGGSLSADGQGEAFGRRFEAAAFPIGIDPAGFARLAEQASSHAEVVRLRQNRVEREIVIGVDRLDYSKGLAQRFTAVGEMLERFPEDRGLFTYLQIAPISRGEVAEYRLLRRELDGLAGRLNSHYAEIDWTPIRYMNRSFARSTLAGFYRLARVGLVTPTRDGMNLVAKEYVAAQNPEDPGVLVLSRFAGAARELRTALIVNPHDIVQIAEAFHKALHMPREERIERWLAMREALDGNTIEHWRESFLEHLAEVPAPR